MNLVREIGKLAARTFTDPRLFGVPAKYIRKGGGEIDIIVTPYKTDENSFAFANVAFDVAVKEFLVRPETLVFDGKRIEPSTDDKIMVDGVSYKLNKGEHSKPFRYLDATESMMIIRTQRWNNARRKNTGD